MRGIMKWLKILALLPISALACDLDISLDEKIYKVCRIDDHVYSQDCKLVSNCFQLPKKMKYSLNQNPLFSICYQSGGTPYYTNIKTLDLKTRVCLNGKGDIVGLGSLMLEYRKSLKNL